MAVRNNLLIFVYLFIFIIFVVTSSLCTGWLFGCQVITSTRIYRNIYQKPIPLNKCIDDKRSLLTALLFVTIIDL